MARKKTKADTQAGAGAEDEGQDPDQQALEATEPDAPGKPVTKAAAIRAALAAGHDTPEAGTDYIRRRFGLEVARQHFSAAKSQMKSRGEASGAGGAGRPRRAPAEGYLAPPPLQGDLLETLESLKPMVATLGADKVKRLVDLLG